MAGFSVSLATASDEAAGPPQTPKKHTHMVMPTRIAIILLIQILLHFISNCQIIFGYLSVLYGRGKLSEMNIPPFSLNKIETLH